jgi:hypothetical protein
MPAPARRRLFSLRRIFLGVLIVAVFFGGTLYALNSIWPVAQVIHGRPTLEQIAPLQPITRSSIVIAPIAVSHMAIRDARSRSAPIPADGKSASQGAGHRMDVTRTRSLLPDALKV